MTKGRIFGMLPLTVAVLSFGIGAARADIEVYDANGQYLGIVVDGNWMEVTIFIPSLKKLFTLTPLVADESLADNSLVGWTYYATPNCTGTPYIPGTFIGVAPVTGKLCEGGYYAIGEPKPKSIVLRSYTGSGCTCIQMPPQEQVLQPCLEATVFTLPFSTPVALPLRYEYKGWDANSDGRMGLEEAIRALQVVSGLGGE